jgi:hypothetical protein
MELNPDLETSIAQLTPLDISQSKSVHLTLEQREQLLIERQALIQTALETIQHNFFRLGKALAEIKEFRLYKADRLCRTWKQFVEYRIQPKLHQSTISDYIGIVKMQVENAQVMDETGLLKLGYKKAKLLKAKYNLIKKIESNDQRTKAMDRFLQIYNMSFEQLSFASYAVYEQQFDFIQHPDSIDLTHTLEENNFQILYNASANTLRITHPDGEIMQRLFSTLKASVQDTSS